MARAALTAACVAVALGTGCARDESPAGAPLEVVPVQAHPSFGPADRATGVVVGDGRVVTVAHVLEPGRRLRVAGEPARVLRRDPALDLAVLAVPGVRARAPRVAAAGDAAHVLVRRRGGVRSLRAEVRRRIRARLVDAPGRPRRPSLELGVSVRAGDSGAPVIDGDGALVGIVYARSTRAGDRAYAVHAPSLRRLLAAAGG